MKVNLKNSSIDFKTFKKTGWVNETNNGSVNKVIATDSYINIAGTIVRDFNNFYISEINLNGNISKIKFSGAVSKSMGFITFRNDNNDIIGDIVTLNSEGLGTDTQIVQDIVKSRPEGATKVLLSYVCIKAEYKDAFKIELFYI